MQEEAARLYEEQEKKLSELYLQENFKTYVKEKFEAKDLSLLNNA